MSNINDNFFDGHYKEIWRKLVPEELTVKEIDFMIPFFNLGNESKVLDLMCGYGRLSIGLARKGIAVTAVDNLEAYIVEINDIVEKEHIPVNAINANVIEFRPNEGYDLAICMGNSFGFFGETDALQLLANVSSSLKKGGHLLIHSIAISEIVANDFVGRSWNNIGDLKYLTDARFLLWPSRVETINTMITADGKSEIKTGIDYIYSINELATMLNKTGLSLKEVYSIPGKKQFTLGDPRAYIIAEKK